MTTKLTQEEWVRRCATRMMRKGVDRPLAMGEAESWIEDNPGDLEDDPESVADDIMSYWSAD